MADFKSGHGLNFEGDKNYLVTTREFADELYQKEMLPECDEVLVPSKNWHRLEVAYRPHHAEPVIRKQPMANLLFNLMVAYKSMRGR